MRQLLLGHTTPAEAFADGTIRVDGDPERVRTFFGSFEPLAAEPVKMALR